MTSNGLSISSGYLHRATQTTPIGPKKLRSGKVLKPEAHDPVRPVAVTNHRNDFNRVQKINDTFNMVAFNLRVTFTALDSIEKKVDRMHDRLKIQVKNFPPFLPGSEERMKFLKNFNTFRKQIDSMTFPPDYDYATKIMADPAVVPGAGDWKIIVGENGPFKTICSKEAHTGPTGLDIPELPEDADKGIIEATIAGMENAKITLKQLRSGLSRDISEIGQLKKQVTQIEDFPESAAEPKSINVQLALANLPGMNLTAEPSNFIDLLDN